MKKTTHITTQSIKKLPLSRICFQLGIRNRKYETDAFVTPNFMMHIGGLSVEMARNKVAHSRFSLLFLSRSHFMNMVAQTIVCVCVVGPLNHPKRNKDTKRETVNLVANGK